MKDVIKPSQDAGECDMWWNSLEKAVKQNNLMEIIDENLSRPDVDKETSLVLSHSVNVTPGPRPVPTAGVGRYPSEFVNSTLLLPLKIHSLLFIAYSLSTELLRLLNDSILNFLIGCLMNECSLLAYSTPHLRAHPKGPWL